MAASKSKLIHYKMTFPPNVVGEPLMSELLTQKKVVPNILRGRITDKGAWLEVTLEGSQKAIDLAIQFLEAKGVAIKTM